MPSKRNIASTDLTVDETSPASKRHRLHEEDTGSQYDLNHSRVAEKYGIVNRNYYPPQIALSRCTEYSEGRESTPMQQLQETLDETSQQRSRISTAEAVVHWFKRDLRVKDNRALSLAAAKAQACGIALVCVFIVSPQDYEAHLTSAIHVDFQLRSLQVLKADLEELDIPLHVETVEARKAIPDRLVELCKGWDANHLFCNIEYEVDELRRESLLCRLCLSSGIDFTAVHDTCVVPPTTLQSGQDKPYSVYSPWYRAWLARLRASPGLLEPYPSPQPNPPVARIKYASIFSSVIPSAPPNKTMPPDKMAHFARLWPAGEHEAHVRLHRFLSEKASRYHITRSLPASNVNSMLSVHLAAGTLSARTCVAVATGLVNGTANPAMLADQHGGRVAPDAQGLVKWIAELAWRDFYKHILVSWPFVCMNAAFKPAYATQIAWSYDEAHLAAWKEGRTGYPFVDAAMRQLAATGSMHNRARMVVASFLAKDLLIDWRLGEQFFMLSLADGDFASNNGGWGFSVGCGVDPQPYMRLFNPVLQGEKFDGDGEYIRRWVPELQGVEGKAVHDPYGRGTPEVVRLVESKRYPRMIIEHKLARERAIRVYGEGLSGGASRSERATGEDIDVGFLPG